MSKHKETRIDILRKERRAKVCVIQKEVLWGFFEQGLMNPNVLYKIEGVPQDCVVDNVGWDFNYNGIVYRILHESFEPIKEGTIPIFVPLTVTVTQPAPTNEETDNA